jgi:tRNA nucleotidyltransferase (CCA-adding enzyme)
MPHWEHFQHQADIGVRGCGHTIASAFEQAAMALTAVIVDPTQIAGRIPVTIDCEAPDSELLLADWLNAVIYQMAVQHLLFNRFTIEISGSRLHATAWGESLNRSRHQPVVEIKGATYTELRVSQGADGEWTAQCVVDV